jgi:hypothetical protein
VGEKRARTLESWRQKIENRARQTAPAKLPPADQRTLTDQTEADRRRLQGERKKADADAQAERNQLQQRIATDRQALISAQTVARADAARRRTQINQQRAKLTTLQGDQARIAAALAAERRAWHRLAHHRYLKFLLVGR